MPTYRPYLKTGDLQIEVEGLDTSSSSYSDALEASIKDLVEQIGRAVSAIPETGRPRPIVLSFGLRALAGGGYAIAQSNDLVNFRITLTWGGGGTVGTELLTGLVPTPQ